jgi:hypothetical protein
MIKFKTFYERAEVESNHKLPALLKFIQKHEEGIKSGSRKDSLKVLRHISNPKKVSIHLLLQLHAIYVKGQAADNVIQFPDTREQEDLVAEADDGDPFGGQHTPAVDIDVNSPAYLIQQALQKRLVGAGSNSVPINHITHKGLVEKLTAQEEAMIQGTSRGPILLYGPSGIGKTVGIREYAIQTAIRDKLIFVELPLRALVSNEFDKDAPLLTVYPDPSDTVSDKTGQRNMIGVPESVTNVLNNVERYFILLTARPSQLNPLIFGGIPGEEEAKAIEQAEGAYSREAKALDKDAKKRQEQLEQNNSPTRFRSISYVTEPGGGDFGHLIKSSGKFSKARGLIFLDEITRVEDDLFFNMIMPYTEPDNMYNSTNWSMVAAGNAGDGFTGVRTIDDTAQKDRYSSILVLKFDPEQWLEYARGQGLNKYLDKWITDDGEKPFEGQNYNTSLDTVFDGKTYAFPEDKDPDDSAEEFKSYEHQTWTPRRILDKVSTLLNVIENVLEEKLEEGDVEWDRDSWLQRMITHLGTEINIEPVADSFLRYYSAALLQQDPGFEVTGGEQGEQLAEYIWRHMNKIPNDISEIKTTFINPFDKKSDVVLAYGADDDNPFAAFNANTEEGKAARIKGIQDVLANDREANKNFTTSILKKVTPLLRTLIDNQAQPIIDNHNQNGVGSHGTYEIVVSMDNQLIGLLYKVAWIFNMLSPARLGSGAGLQFDTDHDPILDEFCEFIHKKIFNTNLQEWAKVLIVEDDIDEFPNTEDPGLDPLDQAIGAASAAGHEIIINPSFVDVDIPVQLGGVTEYNPELLSLKLLVTLIRYITPLACPSSMSEYISELEELLANVITDDIKGTFHKLDAADSDNQHFYQVEPGGRLGNIVFDSVTRPGTPGYKN